MTAILRSFIRAFDALSSSTILSTSALVDPETRTLSDGVLSRIGVSKSLFAPKIKPGECYGKLSPALCAELGCEPIPVIAVCTHDTASAVLAAPAKGDFAYVSCGTWSLFGTELPRPTVSEESERLQYTNEGGHSGTTRFLRNIMGLWLIQESRRQWIREGETVSYADLEREALACEPFVSFIDCDAPEFETAGDLPGRIREFCRVTGQRVPETRGEVMRVIYESLAMKYRENMQKMSSLTGVDYKTLHMVGGGIKDTLLCRLAASAIGIPVVAGPAEATVIGNIAMQLISLVDKASGENLFTSKFTVEAFRDLQDDYPLRLETPFPMKYFGVSDFYISFDDGVKNIKVDAATAIVDMPLKE